MENNYKSNSFKSREQEKVSSPVSEKPRAQKVINGQVMTKKKSGIKKFAESFIAEDMPKVKNYIISDVLIPSFKKAVSDIIRNGIDLILYGETNKNRSSMPGSKVSYRSYYDNPNIGRGYDDRNRVRTVGNLDYDDIVLENRGDAELVLTQMDELIQTYGFVTIADLYDIVGISTNNHCANNYGWTNLSTASPIRTRDGYLLKLPRALPIN